MNEINVKNEIHFVNEKTYLTPTYCDLCEKLLVGLYKQGVQCQICMKNFHYECYKIKDDICTSPSKNIQMCDIFWEGELPYSKDLKHDVYVHYLILTRDCLHIYKTQDLGNKLYEISLSGISKVISYAIVEQENQYLNILAPKAKLHIIINDFHFHIGILTQNYKDFSRAASEFYNMFKLVYLPYSKKNNGLINIKAPKIFENKIEDEYKITDLIGSGTFGKVFNGINRKSNQNVAIKRIDKQKYNMKNNKISIYQTEIIILCNLDHPSITKLLALYNEKDFFIVMERLECNLITMIKEKTPSKLEEDIVKFISYQVLVGLYYLHKRNIAHCDLKLENILVVEKSQYPQIKLCDFGFSKIIGKKSFRKTLIGTLPYNAPEVRAQEFYNKKVDIWALGVIIYSSLSGFFPFNQNYSITNQLNCVDCFFKSEQGWATISENVKNFMLKYLFQVLIKKRADVSKALKHEWFNEDNELKIKLQELETKVGKTWLTDFNIEENHENEIREEIEEESDDDEC